MIKRKCKNPRFNVIVCCQGQNFDYYYYSTLIGALIGYTYQYLKKRKYGTMNFSLKQVFIYEETDTAHHGFVINCQKNVKERKKKNG